MQTAALAFSLSPHGRKTATLPREEKPGLCHYDLEHPIPYNSYVIDPNTGQLSIKQRVQQQQTTQLQVSAEQPSTDQTSEEQATQEQVNREELGDETSSADQIANQAAL